MPAIPTTNFSATKTADPQTFTSAGEIITYTFTTTNNGTASLNGVTIEDPTLPVTWGMPECTYQGGAAITPHDAGVTLAPGDTLTCTATYVVQQTDVDNGTPPTIYNKSEHCVTPAPTGVEECAEPEETITGNPSTDFTLEKEFIGYSDDNSDGEISVGEQIHWRITMTNTGDTTLFDATVEDLTYGGSITCDICLLYTSPSPRDKRQSRMPSSA